MKKPRKKPVYREQEEQIAFFDWLDRDPAMKQVREVTFAIPNARKTSYFMGKKWKREGVRAGVPDVFVGFPTYIHHGLFIEHKVGKGKPSPEQKQRMAHLRNLGYKCTVSHSAGDSINAIKRYLKGENNQKEKNEARESFLSNFSEEELETVYITGSHGTTYAGHTKAFVDKMTLKDILDDDEDRHNWMRPNSFKKRYIDHLEKVL